LKQFLKEPASHLNDLNKIIPALIDANDIAKAQKLICALTPTLVPESDYKYLISSAEQPTDKVVLFISQ